MLSSRRCHTILKCPSYFSTRILSAELPQKGTFTRSTLALPVELNSKEAEQAFLQWQKTHVLAPWYGILKPGTYHVEQISLPFWIYSTRMTIDSSGYVGTPTAPHGAVHWRHVSIVHSPSRPEIHANNTHIYASYEYRRDYVEKISRILPEVILKKGGLAEEQGTADQVEPDMPRSVAWELVKLKLRDDLYDKVSEDLKKEIVGSTKVKDIHMAFTFKDRSVRLVYVPAFIIQYTYGETFNVHGERKHEEFQAIVSGVLSHDKKPIVAGERHYSAGLASLLTGGLCASVVAAWVHHPSSYLFTVEGLFLTLVSALMGGLAVRIFPIIKEQMHEEQRMRKEDAEFERVVSMGLSPIDAGSDDQETLRTIAEWRRWMSYSPKTWIWGSRRAWAEKLYSSQVKRRSERKVLRARAEAEALKREEETVREARRYARWGRSSHHHHILHASSSGRRPTIPDPLGYYKALELDVSHGQDPSEADIKRAFRAAAHRHHPDKHHHGHTNSHEARESFQKIVRAYNVLKNPDSRKKYKRGEL